MRAALGNWGWLGLLAYDSYCRYGRVALGIAEIPHAPGYPRVIVAIYDYLHGKPELDIARLLIKYNPDHEFVVQFLQSDRSVRTLCVRHTLDTLLPKRIYDLILSRQPGKAPGMDINPADRREPGLEEADIRAMQSFLWIRDKNTPATEPADPPSVDMLTMPEGSWKMFNILHDGKGGVAVPDDQKQEYQEAMGFVAATNR